MASPIECLPKSSAPWRFEGSPIAQHFAVSRSQRQTPQRLHSQQKRPVVTAKWHSNPSPPLALAVPAVELRRGRGAVCPRSSLLAPGHLNVWQIPTTSIVGVPEGSVLANILCNIVLDRLDKFVDAELRPMYTRGVLPPPDRTKRPCNVLDTSCSELLSFRSLGMVQACHTFLKKANNKLP